MSAPPDEGVIPALLLVSDRGVARGLGRDGHQRADQVPQQEGDRAGRRLLQSAPLPVPLFQTQGERSLALNESQS